MSVISLIVLPIHHRHLDISIYFDMFDLKLRDKKGLIKLHSGRAPGMALGHVQLEDGGERISGRAVEQTAKCRLAASRRVPSEFHYAHKPHGQFQAMPLVHLKWQQHEHIANLERCVRGNTHAYWSININPQTRYPIFAFSLSK